MLNTIKDLIKQKTAFQEAADLILENDSLDDSIILLHEESDDTIAEVEDTTEKNDEKEEPEEEPAENGDDTSAEPQEKPEEPETSDDAPEKDDILDTPIEDELPTPVGAQTGEPAQIGDDDLLSMEIDLVTNTPKDTLPVPPAGATDVVPGADTTRVDSGFSTADVSEEEDSRDPQAEDEAADILDLPTTESSAFVMAGTKVFKRSYTADINTIRYLFDNKKKEYDRYDKNDKKKVIMDARKVLQQCKLLASSLERLSKIQWDNDDKATLKRNIIHLTRNTTPADASHAMTSIKRVLPGNGSNNSLAESDPELFKFAQDSFKTFNQIRTAYDKLIKRISTEFNINMKNLKNDWDTTEDDPDYTIEQFVEAISIGDDTADQTTDDASASADQSTEEPAADQPTDNAVTAAVKDKVGEMDASNTEPNPNASKEAILKKLGNLSKAIEDTKNLVIDSTN